MNHRKPEALDLDRRRFVIKVGVWGYGGVCGLLFPFLLELWMHGWGVEALHRGLRLLPISLPIWLIGGYCVGVVTFARNAATKRAEKPRWPIYFYGAAVCLFATNATYLFVIRHWVLAVSQALVALLEAWVGWTYWRGRTRA